MSHIIIKIMKIKKCKIIADGSAGSNKDYNQYKLKVSTPLGRASNFIFMESEDGVKPYKKGTVLKCTNLVLDDSGVFVRSVDKVKIVK